MDIKQLDNLLNSARLPESTVTVCLRGDLQAEWERLNAKLAELRAAPGRKLTDNSEASAIAARIREIEGEMKEATLELTLRALPRRDWIRLLRDHPPRKGDEGDKALGLNAETFFDALVPRSIISPELNEDQVSRLMDALSSAQYDKLLETAWSLNRRDVSVPFSPLASLTAGSTDEKSGQRSASASPRAASRGGSRGK